ncbi:MAG: hypothetical protein EOO47_02745 [Flavobacterium sp.]|nr:MAG: hypothetical protein EOO47_02745 [Flavobacterium sp.]
MKSNEEIYREHLETTPTVLRETVDQLQLIILNLAMSGEHAEINESLEENDTMVFEYEDFRNVTDYNVQLLYSIADFIVAKRAQLMNVNALTDE